MKYEIKGGDLPYVVISLNSGETVFSQTGGMAWMTSSVKMETNARGGIGGMLGRAFSGESLFLTNFTAEADNQQVTFASGFPGQIKPFDVTDKEIIIQKSGFLCAENNVQLKTHFTKKLGMGLFGGEGFIMQKVSGTGVAFAEISGAVEEKTLAEGETLVVDTGYVAAYEATVSADVQMIKGIKNMFLGGEGLFVVRLTGPGKVWLQSMPFTELVKKIVPYVYKG